MANAKIRLGLVGVGKIARDQHVPAIAANPRFDLVATASHDGRIEGVPAFHDIDRMIAAGLDLDALVVCTPPSVRAMLAHQALGAGLHVMLEKPPAASVSQAQGLQVCATQVRRSLFAAWHSRETAPVDAAQTWLATRTIERVDVVWREDVRIWHPGQDWLLAAGGFGVFDPAINALSVLCHVLPEPLALDSARLGIPANRQSPMTATLAMRHGRSAPVVCDLSILHSGEQQWDIAVTTDRGVLHLGEGGHRLTIDGHLRPVSGSGEYPRLYARFADLIDTGASDADTRPLTLVADAALLGKAEPLPAFTF